MNPVDFLIIAVIALVIAAAGFAIYRSKKSGKKCIGCPDSGSCASGGCSGKCQGCSGCNGGCGQ